MTSTAERPRVTEPPLVDELFVFGVVASTTRLPDDLEGLHGAALRGITHDGLTAVVCDFAPDRPPGRRRELLGYSQVLDRLGEVGPVVPVRFGAVLPHEDAVVDELLAPRAERLRATLTELTGRSQFTVRAHYLEEVVLREVVSEDPEIATLRRLTRELPEDAAYGERVRLGELVARALEAKQAQDAEVLLDVVLRHGVAHVSRPTTGLDRLLDVAVLVDDRHREAFERDLEDLAEAVHERIRVQLLGPTAPYDFVPED